MLQRVREFFVLVLLALLPFHALFVTFLTLKLAGPGHAPLALLSLWKEMLLVFILFLTVIECFGMSRRMTKKQRKEWLTFDVLDLVILATAVLAAAVSFFVGTSIVSFAYGVRYDLFAPLAFVILRRVPWSDGFIRGARFMLLAAASIVSLIAVGSLFVLASVFSSLGYSDLHSLYVPNGPIAAFQLIGETGIRRVQGSMSGPNQLGMWLLLPLALALIECFRWVRSGMPNERFWRSLFLSLLFLIALLFTFSRSAWVAAAEIAAVTVLLTLSRRQIENVLSMSLAVCVLFIVALFSLSPAILNRATSNEEHFRRPVAAWQSMWAKPWGQGLGTAGPASNRTSDACVLLPDGSDPAWAHAHPDLCVFVGPLQVQPMNRGCSCPVLPENWYLQFGIEMGVTGFALALLTPAAALLLLWRRRTQDHGLRSMFSAALGATVLGLALAGFLLHVWEDTATAFTVWILLAAVLPRAVHPSFMQKVLSWIGWKKKR